MRALLAIVCLTLSSWAHSDDRFYVEIHGGIGNIRVADLAFRPIEAHVSVGGYFIENIGIDLTVGGSLIEDDDDGFEAQTEEVASLSLRFDSPQKNKISAFILVGVSQFTIQQEGTNSTGVSSTVSETFQGGTAALGFKRQIADSPFSIVGVYRLHFVDEPIDLDSFSVGVRAAWK